MSKSIFENYIEIPLREQIRILFLNEFRIFKNLFLSYYINILVILVVLSFIAFYYNTVCFTILYFFYMVIFLDVFFILINPIVFRPKIYYNRDYKNISFNQKKLLNTLSDKNIIFGTLASFAENKDNQVKKEIEKKSVVHLIYFKSMNYKLSSLRSKSIFLIVSYLIFLFIYTILFVFITIDKNGTLSENELFTYSMIIFSIYSLFFYFYMSVSSLFYIKGLKYSKQIKTYDKHFIFDFILNDKPIESSKIYSASNILKKERNYFVSALLAGIFLMYVPLMYDKIYNVNVNVKSIDSKVIQKIK